MLLQNQFRELFGKRILDGQGIDFWYFLEFMKSCVTAHVAAPTPVFAASEQFLVKTIPDIPWIEDLG